MDWLAPLPLLVTVTLGVPVFASTLAVADEKPGPDGPVAPVSPLAPLRLWNANAMDWLAPLPLLVTVTLGVPVFASTLAVADEKPGPDGPVAPVSPLGPLSVQRFTHPIVYASYS